MHFHLILSTSAFTQFAYAPTQTNDLLQRLNCSKNKNQFTSSSSCSASMHFKYFKMYGIEFKRISPFKIQILFFSFILCSLLRPWNLSQTYFFTSFLSISKMIGIHFLLRTWRKKQKWKASFCLVKLQVIQLKPFKNYCSG